ncbi:MAG TPA: VanW family protein [Promicromonospora sp.]|nr:VanW family protein [Promicromonospora sp.]
MPGQAARPATPPGQAAGDRPPSIPPAARPQGTTPPATTPQSGSDEPVPVAVLQTVVNELATPASRTPAPRNGYTPRVFAFERPPKDGVAPQGGSGTTADGAGAAGSAGAGAAGAAAAAGAAQAAAGGPAAGQGAGSGAPSPVAGSTGTAGPDAGASGTGQAAGAAGSAAKRPGDERPADEQPTAVPSGTGSSAAGAPAASTSAPAAAGATEPSASPAAEAAPAAAAAAAASAVAAPAAAAEAAGPQAAGSAASSASAGSPADASPAEAPRGAQTEADQRLSGVPAGQDRPAPVAAQQTGAQQSDPQPARRAQQGQAQQGQAQQPALGAPAAGAPGAVGASSGATPAGAPPAGAPSAGASADAPSPVTPAAAAAGAVAAGVAASSGHAGVPGMPAPGSQPPASGPSGSQPPGPQSPGPQPSGSPAPGTVTPTPSAPGSPAPGAATPTPPAPGAATPGVPSATPPAPGTAPQPPVGGPVPPSGQPRSLIPPSATGAVPPAVGPAPEGQGFLKPLTGAIQRVARWAPVNPQGQAMSSPQGPAGPGTPGMPGGGGSGSPDQPGGFYGLAGDGAPSRGPKVALFAVLGAVVLFGLYTLGAWAVSDTVPRETTVAGVDVGGMTRAEAASALEEQLAPQATEPIAVTAGEGKGQLSPESSGLAVDAQATAAELTGFSLNPVRLWAHLFGGSEEDLVLAIDSEKFDAAVAGLEESLAVEPVDGTVSFVDGQPVKTDAKDGTRVVASETASVVTERWLRADGPFDLPTEAVPPVITQAKTDAAFAVAQKVVSGPVTVEVGGQKPQLSPEALAGLVRFEQKDAELVTLVDGDAAVEAVVDATDNLLQLPDDAHFEFVGGKPTIVDGKTGTTLDPAETADAVRVAATSDDRETSVELVEQTPEDTVESLEKLGVKEIVSEFSTPLTNEKIRTQNLIRGSEMVTGTLVKPGETFSLLEALAPITLENGYFDAGVVEDGKHVEAVGGGLSQMATTSFNAGFFAGFDDIEHHAHSYWFPRYPAGREATIYVGAKDMKFRNDTPYGAVMQAFVADGHLTVRIWSTKHYTVQESTSPKRNVVPKQTIHDSSPDCQAYPGGEDGFSVTIARKVLHDGKVVKENSFNHTYRPDNAVVCDG